MVAHAVGVTGLVQADIVRLIVVAACAFILVTIATILWETRDLDVILPPVPLRLLLSGMACFLAAVMYALLRLIGTPARESISWLSGFAIIGLILKLGGLVWIYFDHRAHGVEREVAGRPSRRHTDL